MTNAPRDGMPRGAGYRRDQAPQTRAPRRAKSRLANRDNCGAVGTERPHGRARTYLIRSPSGPPPNRARALLGCMRRLTRDSSMRGASDARGGPRGQRNYAVAKKELCETDARAPQANGNLTATDTTCHKPNCA
eukprot:9473811-Pyramimonas_sp.AAC.1